MDKPTESMFGYISVLVCHLLLIAKFLFWCTAILAWGFLCVPVSVVHVYVEFLFNCLSQIYCSTEQRKRRRSTGFLFQRRGITWTRYGHIHVEYVYVFWFLVSMLRTDNILNIFRPGGGCIYLQLYLSIAYMLKCPFELQRILCFELIAKANSNWFIFPLPNRSLIIQLSLGSSNTWKAPLVKPMFRMHYPNSSPSDADGSTVLSLPLLMQ